VTLKVLVVDDSRSIRMIVKNAFDSYDSELVEAENGVEGLALAEKESPDLIILDMELPVLSGLETLGKLKADPVLKGIPVFLMMTETGQDAARQIVRMDVQDYIVKPFTEEQLLRPIKRIVTLQPKTDIS